MPSTMVATPRAVPVALGPLEGPPPVEIQHHRRRRLVIVSQLDGGSDTETLRRSESRELETASGDGLSDGEGVVEEPSMFEDPVNVAPRASQHVAAFRTLEAWSLAEIFQRRACVMRSVPFIMKAAYRGAMRVALQEVMRGRELNCGSRVSRGWKLFLLLLPRLLLFRSPRGRRVPKKQLEDRLRLFHSGQWSELWASSMCLTENSVPERSFELDPVEFLVSEQRGEEQRRALQE